MPPANLGLWGKVEPLTIPANSSNMVNFVVTKMLKYFALACCAYNARTNFHAKIASPSLL
jgi:hypothetical protein